MNFGDYLSVFLLILAIASFVISGQSFLSGEFYKSFLALVIAVVFVICLVFIKPWLTGRA